MEPSKLNYTEIGSGSNILVLLHAYPVNNTMFSKLDNFLPEGWKAILPDFPGFGNTSIYADDTVMSMKVLAEQVHQLIPDKFDQFIIGGVSMGGYVTMAFAELYPDLASGYILMNTRDSADADGGAGRKEVVKKIELGKREEYIKELVPKLLGKTSLSNRIIIEEVVSMIQSTSNDAIIQTSRGMGLRPDRSSVLENTGKPILLITGAEDEITGPEVMKDMQMRYKNVEYHVIPKAGHYAVFEQPEVVSSIFANYLPNFTQ